MRNMQEQKVPVRHNKKGKCSSVRLYNRVHCVITYLSKFLQDGSAGPRLMVTADFEMSGEEMFNCHFRIGTQFVS